MADHTIVLKRFGGMILPEGPACTHVTTQQTVRYKNGDAAARGIKVIFRERTPLEKGEQIVDENEDYKVTKGGLYPYDVIMTLKTGEAIFFTGGGVLDVDPRNP
jgi:hypothetical protein